MKQRSFQITLFLTLMLFVLAGMILATATYAGGDDDGIIDPAPPPPEMPTNPYGVWLLPPDMEGGPKLREADALWTTLFVQWSAAEKSPGTYDWSQWDAILGKAAEQGYLVIITVTGNPAWAADTGCGPIQQDHLDEFAAFIQKAVERYSQPPYNVLYWSFYNEPDNSDPVNFAWLGGCWGFAHHPNAAPGAGGKAYANMLKHVYPAVKTANPNAYVVLGGLAYDYFTEPDGGPFDAAFLDDILAAGGGDYFDVLNFHYYPWSGWRWEPDGANRYNRHIAFKARWLATEVYNATGRRKPIICTEVGETSHNKDNVPDYHRQILVIYQNILGAQSANVYPILWFTGIDLEFSISYDRRRYGLLNLDGSPKPSYYAYKALTTELKDATFVRPRSDLPSRFEGYEFNDRGRTKTVLWMYANYPDYPPPQPVTLPVSQPGGSFRVVKVRSRPQGDDDLNIVSENIITDGGQGDGDGWVNGKIQVQIDEDIRFFEDLSMPTYTPTPTPTSTPRPNIHMYLPVFLR